jgi:hypothetical protein
MAAAPLTINQVKAVSHCPLKQGTGQFGRCHESPTPILSTQGTFPFSWERGGIFQQRRRVPKKIHEQYMSNILNVKNV